MDAYNTEAYNIASVNALMDNVDEAIRWAKIPLEEDRKTWLEKIKNDKDFDRIHKNQKFMNFLAEQERLIKK